MWDKANSMYLASEGKAASCLLWVENVTVGYNVLKVTWGRE